MSGFVPPPNTPDISASMPITIPPKIDLEEAVSNECIRGGVTEFLFQGSRHSLNISNGLEIFAPKSLEISNPLEKNL